MVAKGNLEYLRHYERFFDHVTVAYLAGSATDALNLGRTSLVTLGGRTSNRVNIVLAPLRVLRLFRRTRPAVVLTADLVYTWWTSLLVRLIHRAKVVLMPVSIPDELYAASDSSLAGLPRNVERMFTAWSFASSSRVIMGRNSVTSLRWLRSTPAARRKLRVVACTVEEYPPPSLLDALSSVAASRRAGHPLERRTLLYVGRLHQEKLVLDLVDVLAFACNAEHEVRLVVAGDGDQRTAMEHRSANLGVADRIDFRGFVTGEDLVRLYADADVFISTVTGTSLREAGLARLPVVAYAVDWARDLLVHEKTALVAPAGDAVALGLQVTRALTDAALADRIAEVFHAECRRRWDPSLIDTGLADAFADYVASTSNGTT